MVWNRDIHGRFLPLEMAFIQHFSKYDSCNRTAMHARLAELRLKEKAERSLVTPPEELRSWKWFNARRPAIRNSVSCGDPSHARSALGGWVQVGKMTAGHAGFQVKQVPSIPIGFREHRIFPWKRGSSQLSPAGVAIMNLRGCRFPHGDTKGAEFRFCNEPRRAGSSYCPLHAKECHEGAIG